MAGVALLTTTAPSSAADVSSSTTAKPRPRIGLVLSGGGARGYAHLGVLQYLEKLHVPVDYIAATSMGALVGGLYATGISAEDLEQRLSQTNLSDIAFDRNERAKLPQSQREDDFQYPISIAAGYDDGKLKLAPGLVQGNNLLTLLQNWTAQLPADISFSHLPIPFRAVATDLGKGTEVILERGSLPRAMRASMAVPGLFAPYPIDGRTLVDGGLVSNLPVQEARDMGADVIIAVNIATPLQDPANLQSPTAVAQQMVGILIQQNVKAQKALLGKSDVLIEPELSGMSFTDFARGKDGVNAGWNAAQKQSTRLTELSLPPVEWQAYLAARQAGPILARDTRVDAIEIKTTGRIPAAYVRSRLSVKEGDVYDADKINQQLSQLATNGDFNALTQEIVEKDGRHVLLIDAEEKSWGPQYLLFGLGISNTFDGRGSVNLQIGHRYPWMNQSGLEWRNDLLLGNKRASLHSELRQPVFGASGLYVSPYVDISRRYVDAYLDGSDAKASPVTQYRIDSSIAGVDLGMPLARLGDLRLGVSYQHIKYTPTYNLALGSIGSLFDATQSSQPVARARLTIDQLDDPLFPRKGYYIYSEINRGFGQVDNRYSDAQLRTLWAFSSDRNTFNVALEAASNLSSNNAGPGFFLGGFQRLSAYAPDQFYGSSLLYSRLTYLRDLTDYSLLGLRNPVLGSSLEAGNVWQTRNAFGDGPYKKSLSLFLGGNSPVGPVYFGAAVGQQAIWNLYLQLGRVF
ncbi:MULTISPECIES: patatin-like phospholipase family protein [unclassified Herbaspirillum]|uniref:patatin-like phospholipase family protein n=1 Tax=unclassified Herbaspirillum TaxID=2624150 RepID=UPI000E2E91FB|nr:MULTISPECIES: patatin-like phospholipase family protein [unclassified Herbaspirillum]RFB74224.1 patatin [Herbaspirillum sp. 3R-3a1]TFI11562.1 patatin [Herbaspirillum sp. 3R11]TFI17465.1 patatin [Herbaspirillum sp. 3R-11]